MNVLNKNASMKGKEEETVFLKREQSIWKRTHVITRFFRDFFNIINIENR